MSTATPPQNRACTSHPGHAKIHAETAADPGLYESVTDWLRDNDLTPALPPGRGGPHSAPRCEVSEGRVARAERMLAGNGMPEDVAKATGLRLNVVNMIAERVAERQIVLEKQHSTSDATGEKEARRARVRQEWLAILNERHLLAGHGMLLAIAENMYEARCYWEACHIAQLAVVVRLRLQLLWDGGKHSTHHTDPKTLLLRLRQLGTLEREDFRRAAALCYSPEKARRRAEVAISLGRLIAELFADTAVDGTKPARDLPEALREYGVPDDVEIRSRVLHR